MYQVKKNYKQYKKNLDIFAKNVSKQSHNDIEKHINKIDKLNIPNFEKTLARGTIYKKLTPEKRRLLTSSFGNLTPGSNAALTTQAAAVAQQTMAAATQAAVTQAAVTQAAATQAAGAMPGVMPGAMPGAIPGASISQPGFVPVSGQSVMSQPVGQVSITRSGAKPISGYPQAAGALYMAQDALTNAATQLTRLSAAQNISGFGRYI